MSESALPPRYVAYPRERTRPYGTVQRLEALGQGYFGLSRAFALSMVILILVFILIANLGRIVGENRMIGIAIFLAYSVLAGFLILPSNRKICYGRNWPIGYAVSASILNGLTSFFCFGMLGILVMQQLALSEIRRFGDSG